MSKSNLLSCLMFLSLATLAVSLTACCSTPKVDDDIQTVRMEPLIQVEEKPSDDAPVLPPEGVNPPASSSSPILEKDSPEAPNYIVREASPHQCQKKR